LLGPRDPEEPILLVVVEHDHDLVVEDPEVFTSPALVVGCSQRRSTMPIVSPAAMLSG
jgi:hypothetical protein